MLEIKETNEKKLVNNQAFYNRAKLGIKLEKVIVYLLIGLIALTMILPFAHALAKSFSYPTEVEAGKVNFIPKKFTFGNYYYFWRKQLKQLGRAFLNTVFVTVVGIIFGVFNTALMAFPLSRPKHEFRWSGPILVMVIFCFVFQRPMIPYFLAVKSYGLMDTHWALILPHTVIPFYLFLTLTSFRGLPEDFFDACRIDGATDFQIFFRVVLPLSKAVLATVAIFLGVQLWNLFFHPLIFIRTSSLQLLQPIVRQIMSRGGDVLTGGLLDQDPFKETESIKSALIILTTIPVVIVYPFFQKYFTKGTLVGAIKA